MTTVTENRTAVDPSSVRPGDEVEVVTTGPQGYRSVVTGRVTSGYQPQTKELRVAGLTVHVGTTEVTRTSVYVTEPATFQGWHLVENSDGSTEVMWRQASGAFGYSSQGAQDYGTCYVSAMPISLHDRFTGRAVI